MSTEPRNHQELAILARQYANAWVWHHGRGCYVSRADYTTTTADVATAIAGQEPHVEATHDDTNAILAADYYVLTARLLADNNARALRDAQWRHNAYSTPDSLAALGKARLAADYSAALLHETTTLAKTVHEQEFLSDASPHVQAAYWAALNPGPVSTGDALAVLWRDAANIAVHQGAIDYGNDGPPEADHALPTTQRTRQETSIDLIAHHTGLPRSFIHQEINTAADAYNYAPGTDDDPDYLGPPDWHDLATRYTPLSGQPTAQPEAHTVTDDNPEGETAHQQARDAPTSPDPDEIQRVCDYLLSREPHRDPDALWDHAEHLVELGYTAQTLTEWNAQLDAYLADEKTILRETEKRHQLYNYLAQQHPTETTPEAEAPIAALVAKAEDITSRPPTEHDDNARKLQRLANELTLARALLESGELPADRHDEQTWYVDYLEDELALAQAASDSPGVLTPAQQTPAEASARPPDQGTRAGNHTVTDQAEGTAHDPGQLGDELDRARTRLASGNLPAEQQAHDEPGGVEVTAPQLEAEPNQAAHPGTGSDTGQQAGEDTSPLRATHGTASHHRASSPLRAGPGSVTGARGDALDWARRAVGHLDAHRIDSFRGEGFEPPTAGRVDLGW